MTIVDTCGVWKRGCTRPKASGNAPWRAIDSMVREAGRIVVCVDESADVMIAMTTSLSSGEPSDVAGDARRRSPASSSNSATRSRPANATTAMVVSR